MRHCSRNSRQLDYKKIAFSDGIVYFEMLRKRNGAQIASGTENNDFCQYIRYEGGEIMKPVKRLTEEEIANVAGGRFEFDID